ncbi:MAG TPA: glycosyltransferase family 39 protein [Panacibacter sp.]|nr:glycosyltransferase family 39 protein [Panacibacter sp.]HNP45010.1 glycosyltransferase family 39 protein [Panacibacter sp.]
MNNKLQKYFPLLVLIGIVLNATGLTNPILEPDGTLYATIAKHMALTNDWINLFGDNHDWLDKPHFPFWVTAASYKAFGINSFAYKFPGFVFWLIGLRFTYLLALRMYNKETAQAAVLVYLVALHTVIANFDVRAEPYLTTLTIASIYYFYREYKERKWQFLLAAAFFAGCAVMTKGIFALLTIGGGFVIYWIVTKQWKEFVNLRWYILVALTGIFILPELYCLYAQFDAHPEKMVFGQTGVSGVKFFFWDSQFGRFFNTGPIKGSGDPSFFLHTMLWAFLPWSLFFYMAIFKLIRERKQNTGKERWIIYGSAGLTFILFSLSSFQLPHYIIIFFPQCAIIAADYLLSVYASVNARLKKIVHIILLVLLFVGAVLVVMLAVFTQTSLTYLCIILAGIVLIIAIFFWSKASLLNSFFMAYAFGFLLYPFLNFFFYPMLFKYQSGMQAAEWIKQNGVPGKLAMYKEFSHAFEFYSAGEPTWIYDTADMHKHIITEGSMIVYMNKTDSDSLAQSGFVVKSLKHFDYFRISMLTGSFLNPSTRNSAVTKMEVAEISRKE